MDPVFITRYAHWLDSEFLRMSRIRHDRVRQPVKRAETFLKLHALFGSRIVLSDIQLLESEAVLDSFADPDFRSFLATNQEFLQLVAKPADNRDRFSITVNGCVRACDDYWTSSLWKTPATIRELSTKILDAGAIDKQELLATTGSEATPVLYDGTDGSRLITGLIYGLDHFGNTTFDDPEQTVRAPKSPMRPKSYFNILCEVKSSIEEHGVRNRTAAIHLSYINDTIDFVRKTLNTDDEIQLGRRSLILNHLSNTPRENWNVHTMRRWNTIINAWNCAVDQTVEAHGASVGNLPNSVPIGLYRGHVTSGLIPYEEHKGGIKPTRLDSHWLTQIMSWDPGCLTWNDVRLACEQTNRQRNDFQEALLQSPKQAEETAQVLFKELAKLLSHTATTRLRKRLLFLVRGIEVIKVLSEQPHGTGYKYAVDYLEQLGNRGNAWQVANTLNGAANRLIQERWLQ